MNAIKTHDHDWALGRLMGYSTGMLPEDQMLRMEEHLRGCDDCRTRLEPLKALSAADAGHLPASMIATWSRSSKLLKGIERSLVESHLRACGSCRATLEFAGFEPVLAAESAPVRARAQIVEMPVRRRAWAWAFGFSAAAAAAAAFILIAQPALFHIDGQRSSATMSSPVKSGSVAFDLGLLPSTPGAIALPSPVPQGAPYAAVDAAAAAGGLVVLLPAKLPLDAGESVTLALYSHGNELARKLCRYEELGAAVRIRTTAKLPADDYELRLTPESATGRTSFTWPLRVR